LEEYGFDCAIAREAKTRSSGSVIDFICRYLKPGVAGCDSRGSESFVSKPRAGAQLRNRLKVIWTSVGICANLSRTDT
jgi:hypothetical protein